MRKAKSNIIWQILVIAAILGGGGFFIKQELGNNAPKESFITATIDRGDIQKGVSASGTLNPVKLVDVGTQISGVVKILNVDFNDAVTEGQVLAELDPALLKAQVSQSKASLANAEASKKLAEITYKRSKELLAQKYTSNADFEKTEQALEAAKAAVETAKAQLERDQINLEYTIIRSPVSGVIISRSVDIGQTVAASFQTPTLFKIAQDLKKMQIDTNLSEADVGSVKEGQQVHFTVDAFPGRQFAGSVRQVRLNSTTVQNVVTYNVVIDVENADMTLLPGMTAFATLVEDHRTNSLRIPNAALSFKPAKEKAAAKNKPSEAASETTRNIYLLQNGKPEKTEVSLGISDGKFTEVTGDKLKEGDVVITGETGGERKSGGASKSPMGGMRMF